MLSITFGVTCLFKHFNIPFPASVACLVLLFLGLLFAEAVLGAHRTRKIVAVVDVPVCFLFFGEKERQAWLLMEK